MTQTFHITLNPVDDSLPVVQNVGMRVQEGMRKMITEFELQAVDADTEVCTVPGLPGWVRDWVMAALALCLCIPSINNT